MTCEVRTVTATDAGLESPGTRRLESLRYDTAGSWRRHSAFLFLIVSLLVCVHRLPAAESVLFAGAVVHTVSGADLSPGDVLVRDGRIVQVAARIEAPDAQKVDLAGLHLYPGLIAATTSLGLVEINAVRATRDMTEVGEFTPDVQSWISVNPDSELIPVARANGVTHVNVVPTGAVISGHSAVIALTGWTFEEMLVRGPAALHLSWPAMELDLRPREQARDRSRWKSPDDQARERRGKIKAIEDFFGDARAYQKARAAAPAATNGVGYNPPWEAMLPVLRGEIPVIVHADDLRAIKAAVAWARREKIRMVLAGGKDAWMAAALLASNQVPVIYERTFNLTSNLGATPARDTDPYDITFRAPALLAAAGVKVILSEGVGGDAAAHLRNLPYTAAQAIAFGFPAAEALKSITLYPAEILGVTNRLGSIEPGKEASLFAADGDIFDIRRNVKRLWIAGNEVPLDTRHTRLYEKYKARPKPRHMNPP